MSTPVGARLDGRDNALNCLRLVLASAVIVGHAYPLGGHGDSRIEGLSGIAVDGFFALSGFLIAGSRMRIPMRAFLIRRCLRILPGFWACLIVTALVFAPVSALSSGDYDPASAVGYVFHNAALTMNQYGIDHTLSDVPFPDAWNGSLWTLEYEFAAYVAAGLLLGLSLVRRNLAAVLTLLTLGLMAIQVLAHGPLHVTTNQYLNTMRLGGFFLAGMAMWALRERVPVRRDLMVVSGLAVVTVFLMFEDYKFDVLMVVPLTYLLLALGATLPVRIGSVNDVSYGVYIYAFPVQQLLVLHGARDLGVVLFSVIALLLTIPLAWGSWLLVERPCLRLAQRLTRRPRVLVPQTT